VTALGVTRAERVALAVLFAIIPLYGSFYAFASDGPGTPVLVSRPGAVLVALAGLAALLAIVPAAARAARRDALTFAFLAPGAATIAAAVFGFDPSPGIGLGVFVTGLGASGLVLARTADAQTVRLCLRTFLWAALAAGLLALAMLAAHRPGAIYAYHHARAVGTFLNPNELAAFTIVALGAAVPLAAATRGRDRLATACAVVMAVTLGATFSRWGALSAVCGIAVYALATRARVLLAAAVLAGLAGIALNAALGAGHHNPRDTESRVVAWRTGLTTFERFPLLGVGPTAFGRTYDAMRPPQAPGARTAVAFDPHSLPIAFAAEGGIVALVVLTVSFTLVLREVVRSARGAAALPRALAFGLAAALVGMTVDVSINTLSLFFPLGLQVVPLAVAVVRTDALR
jgi:O-antigen ligase